MMPFGVNSDPILRAQKQRNRVRGCVVGDAPILLPRLRRHLALGHKERGVYIMIITILFSLIILLLDHGFLIIVC